MVSRLRRFLNVLLSVAMVSMSFPISAPADIYNEKLYNVASPDNVSQINEWSSTWREGWGNQLHPRFEVTLPSADETQPAITGAHYFIDREPSTYTTPFPSWDAMHNAPISGPGPWNLNVDIESEVVNPGPLFDPSSIGKPVDASQDFEGPFVLYYQCYTQNIGSPYTGDNLPWLGVDFGIDVTPPVKVTGLGAWKDQTATIPLPASTVTTQSRVVLTWDDTSPLTASGRYDALSGTGYFEAFVNGVPHLESYSTTSTRVYDYREHYDDPSWPYEVLDTPRQMTIEDLPAGENKIRVRAVDRATNAGELSTETVVIVDPDRPVVSITSPSVSGQHMGALPSFSANATDQAGVASVTFALKREGEPAATVFATMTEPSSGDSYEASYSGPQLTDGLNYVLEVTAQDLAGRTYTVSSGFVVDNKPELTITTPIVGEDYSPLVPIHVNASDLGGVENIVFRVDGSTVQTYYPERTPELASSVTALVQRSAGTYETSVTVTNMTGGVTTASRTFTVNEGVRPDLSDFSSAGESPQWFNTAYPLFTRAVDEAVLNPIQMLYTVDRSAATQIDGDNPADYDSSYRLDAGTTYFTGVIDQMGVYLSDPARFDGALQMPGASAVEGIWYQHSLLRDALGGSTDTMHHAYGVDLTPPDAVDSVTAHAFSTATTEVVGWLDQSRAVIRWTGREYDLLSGTDRYNVYVDGVAIGDETDVIAYESDRAVMSVTLEDLSAGSHLIQVSAVDEAGNEGLIGSGVTVKVKSVPKVKIVAPSADTTISRFAPISIIASDDAGIAKITVAQVGTDTVVTEKYYTGDPKSLALTVYPEYPSGLDKGDYTVYVSVESTSTNPDGGPSMTTTSVNYHVDGSLQPEVGATPTLWYDTEYPIIPFVPSTVPTAATEALYLVDRAADTVIDPANPNVFNASFAFDPFVTHSSGVIDQNAIYLTDPVIFDGLSFVYNPRSYASATRPIEGWWYFHALVRNALGEAGEQSNIEYGIDLTDPPAVSNISLHTSATAPPISSGLLLQKRAVLKWDGTNQDALSGTDKYLIRDNGLLLQTVPFQENRPGGIMSLTIEDLADGLHDLRVYAVDRAGNVSSEPTPTSVLVDTESPTVSLQVAVGAGTTVPSIVSMSAVASDACGIANVRFLIDGACVATVTSEPFVLEDFDLSAIADGDRTFTASTTDIAGRTGTSAPLVLTVDKRPTVSSLLPWQDGLTFSRLVPFKVSASDVRNIASVSFAIDGAEVASYTPSAGSTSTVFCSPEYLAAGNGRIFTATVVNSIGSSRTVTRTINVSETARPIIEDFITGDSSTNGEIAFTNGWNNTLYPAFRAVPGVDTFSATEMLYLVDRSPMTTIDPEDPNNYYGSFRTSDGTTHYDGLIDQEGVFLSDPVAFDGSLQASGTRDVEGIWYTHAVLRDSYGNAGPTIHTAYGIDISSPSTVTGLAAYKSITATTPATVLINQSRATLRWTGEQYDALSGTDHYNVYVDGVVVPDVVVPYQANRTSMALTIENLAAGNRSLQVSAVDKAGNVGPLSAPSTVTIDLAAPSVSITSPAVEGAGTGSIYTFSASASDDAGVAQVRFLLDGTCISTDTAAPYEVSDFDLAGYTEGTHTLVASVTDVVGRVASSAPRSFVVNKKPTGGLFTPASDGMTFSTIVPLRAWARDARGLSSVVFSIDGSSVETFTISAGTTETLVSSDEYVVAGIDHTITATIYNSIGSSLTVTRTLDVSMTSRPDLSDFRIDEFGRSYTGIWYNTAYPGFGVFPAAATPWTPTEMLYSVDRSPQTVVDASRPNDYDISFLPDTYDPHFSGVIDQNGVYLSDPARFDGELQYSEGVNDPIEGIWYTHAVLRDNSGHQSEQLRGVYGVDLTPPSAVSTVTVHAFSTATTQVVDWMDQTRAVVRWDSAQCDTLSGVAYFQLYLDGAPLIGQGTMPFDPSRDTMAITFEDLDPGQHTVAIAAVDAAGNRGPLSSPAIIRVKSMPTVTITAPSSNNTTVSKFAALRASATDASGLDRLEFAVAGTDTTSAVFAGSAATTMSAYLYAGLDTGDYTLTVTAYSISGNSSSATVQYHVDGTLPPEDEGGGEGGSDPSEEETAPITWHNTPFPTFDAAVSDVPTSPTEVLYLVDRAEGTAIDPLLPNNYNASFNLQDGVPHINGVIDQNGVYLSNPAAFDGRTIPRSALGASDALEGWWYIHALVRNIDGVAGATTHLEYGVDLTPPPAVDDVIVYPSAQSAIPVTAPLFQNRIVVKWDGINYDALSGTTHFLVYVDGEPLAPEQGLIGWQNRATMSVTIEDLPSGVHDIQVSAVDRAGNEGPLSDAYTVQLDTSAPSVAMLTPSDDSTLGAITTLAASASDDAGVAYVRFLIDGTCVATDTAAPYEVSDFVLSAFGVGAHTLVAEATDVAGRISTSTPHDFTIWPPQIEVLAPAAGVTVGATTSFVASVTPDAEAAHVRFLLGATCIATDTVAPWVLEDFDLSGYTDGAYVLTAEVTDLANRQDSQSFGIEIDKSAAVEILSPAASGMTFGQLVPLKIRANDSVDISTIDFVIDTLSVESFTPAPGTTSTVVSSIERLAPGVHTFTATIVNALNSTRTVTTSLTVSATRPVVLGDFVTGDSSSAGTLDMVSQWFNDEPVYPAFNAVPGSAMPDAELMFYTVDRDPMTRITSVDPLAYDVSYRVDAGLPHFSGVIDQYGVFLSNPAEFDGRTLQGTDDPLEGVWYQHAALRNGAGNLSDTFNAVYGVDLTDPDAVTGLDVRAFSGATTSAAGVWLDQTRAVVRFDGAERDLLSGTDYFKIYLDGEPLAADQGTIVFDSSLASRAITFEDIGPGRHTVSVSAVDRAGNESALSAPVQILIMSTPEIALTSPALSGSRGETLTTLAELRATVTDPSGIDHVTFSLEGTSSGDATFTPLAGSDDTLLACGSNVLLPASTTQTITVTAYSQSGRVATVVRQFDVISAVETPDEGGGSSEDTATMEWFRTDNIQMHVTPSTTPTDATELLYVIDRISDTPINPLNPNGYSVSFDVVNGEVHSDDSRIDIGAAVADNPSLNDGRSIYTTPPAVAYEAVEGVWYAHVMYRNAAGDGSGQGDKPFGIDVTRPRAVTGVSFYASATAPSPISGALAQNRVQVRWDGAEFDEMSGTDHYNLYVDGEVLDFGEGTVGFQPGRATMSLTLEMLDTGLHTIEVRAVDKAGNESLPLATPASVLVDLEAPTVTLVTPADGENVGAESSLVATATDDSGISYVRFLVDGTCVATASAAPYEVPDFVFSAFAVGPHSLVAEATDFAGGVVLSATHSFTVTAPYVGITSPVSGATLRATQSFVASASPEAQVASVEFYLDGALVGSANSAPYEVSDVDLSGYADGAYTLSAVVTDVAGHTASDSFGVTLDKAATALILSPAASGLTFSQLVPFKVEASDVSGITSIVFEVDGLPVEPFTPTPGTTSTVVSSLEHLSLGAHTFTATVVNVLGSTRAVSTSLTVTSSARPDIEDFRTGQGNQVDLVGRWFNTEYPVFSAVSGASLPNATEMLYDIDRSPMTTINPLMPNDYYVSFRTGAGTTHFSGVIDQNGVYLSDPPRFDGESQYAEGVNDPLEGIWYTHALMRDAQGNASDTYHAAYGVDLTQPSAVSTVSVHAFSTATTQSVGWMDQTRAVIRWDSSQCDALSGVDYFKVYVDGEAMAADQGIIDFQPDRSTMSLTFEDLAPGIHSVEVSAVDKAGNEGDRSAPAFIRIKSIPAVTITAPASADTTISKFAALRANATDASGLDRIEYAITGTDSTATVFAGDAKMAVSTYFYPALDTGDYTLTVTAYSISGPSSSASINYHVDGTLPPEGGSGGETGGGEEDDPASAFVWHGTAFPTFDAVISDIPTDATEVLYLVDRTEDTAILAADPNAYYASFNMQDQTPHMNGVIDQNGVYLSDPLGFNGMTIPRSMLGASDPIEGWWYIHALARNAAGEGGAITHLEYGVDITPPPAVEDVAVYSSADAASPVSTPLLQNRIVVRWEGTNRDALSGTDYFRVYVDGEPLADEQGTIGYQTGRAVMSMTIEDLPSGVHEIAVSAVDRAGNEGQLSDSFTVQLDTSAPVLTITAPGAGETVGSVSTFAAEATDDAGIGSVRFFIDGVPLLTDTIAPYAMVDFDLSGYPDGTHTLTVVATDIAARTTTAVRSFTIDKKPIVSILQPAEDGQAFSRLVPLKVAATDRTGIDMIMFTVDSIPVETVFPAAGTTSTIACSLEYLTPGVHTFVARVTNELGVMTTTAVRTFTVDSALRPDLDDFITGDGTADGTLDLVSDWFNTEYPTFTAYAGPSVPDATEMLYQVDRTPMTVIDPALYNSYYTSYRTNAGTTHFSGVIDQGGVYLSNPTGFNGANQMPSGVSQPTEGIWYTHALMRNAVGDSGPTMHAAYGIDLTDPSAVTGVAAYENTSAVVPTSAWLDQTRAVIRWDGTQVDALSGVDHYKVYLNGMPFDGDQGTIAFQPGRATMSLTVEDLSPGLNTFQVSAVDKAGNEGALSAPAYVRIMSTPTVTITSPASEDVTLTSPAPLRAIAQDPAGLDHVEFSVSGTTTVWSFPGSMSTMSLQCSTYAALPTGAYTLTVTAFSNSGSSVSATRNFGVDASLPPVIDPGGGETTGTPTVTTSMIWYPTARPDFDAQVTTFPVDPTELIYLVDRTPDSALDPTAPNDFYASFRVDSSTTHRSGIIDQWGVYYSNPGEFDGNLQLPGRIATDTPIEGIWYIHMMQRNADGEGGGTAHVAYGVDLTAPLPVTNVVARETTYSAPVSGWMDQSRVVLQWDGSQRDVLSGVDHYNVYVDGVLFNDDQGVIGFQPGRATMSLTIEDLDPGSHSFVVTAVDEAGNESGVSNAAYAGVDSDSPLVSMTSPSNGALVGLSSELKAVAVDGAGVRAIGFYVGNTCVGTSTASALTQSYIGRVKPDWSALTSGYHTVYAVAVDAYGHRTVSDAITVKLDKTPPVLTYVSAGPSPFYPRLKNGYKDYFKVNFKTSEDVTAKLVIKNSNRTVVRTITGSRAAGSTYMRWDGIDKYHTTRRSIKKGTFYWSLQLTDAAGNTSNVKSGTVKIALYTLVRTSSNTVRVVYR